MMNDTFENLIQLEIKDAVEAFITPITPYFICNHFISTEIHSNSGWRYIEYNIDTKANDLLKNNNYSDIKNMDIIQIQVIYFDFFYENILPIIVNKNIKVIIITSQWHLPSIERNYKTDALLNNNHILLWISQNPIYENHKKYMPFPYGLFHHQVNEYIKIVKKYERNHKNHNNKKSKIINQNSSVHSHLPSNHIRRKYDIFGKNSGPRLNYDDYLKNISDSEYVISTAGDRNDCYRHYETIGLNAIPVSNIRGGYQEIFEENMIYSNAEDMIIMIQNQVVNHTYKPPNRDMLTIFYWVKKIHEKLYQT